MSGAESRCARQSQSRLYFGAENVVGGDGTNQTFEDELADGLEFHQMLDGGNHAGADEDLAVRRLGAEPGAEVGDPADRSVVGAALEPDPAEGRVALGDANPEAELGGRACATRAESSAIARASRSPSAPRAPTGPGRAADR